MDMNSVLTIPSATTANKIRPIKNIVNCDISNAAFNCGNKVGQPSASLSSPEYFFQKGLSGLLLKSISVNFMAIS